MFVMRQILIIFLVLFAVTPAPRAEAAVLRGPGYAATVTLPSELPNGRRWFFALIEPQDWRVWRRDAPPARRHAKRERRKAEGERQHAAPWRRAFVLVLPQRVKRRYPVLVLMRFNRNAPDPEPDPVDQPPAVTPLPAPLGFLLAGLGALALVRRSQSASATP